MLQNVGTTSHTTGVKPYKQAAFDEYLTFCALGGIITSDTGSFKQMSAAKFCERVDVTDMTLSRWKRQTPNFDDLVRDRRNKVVGFARETKAFNSLYLIGTTSLGNSALHHDQRAAVDALKAYLGHFSKLQTPVQRQDIKVEGGLTDVLAIAKRDGILEGETVEPTDADAGTGQEAPGALPLPS